jgi:hypothetical protein
VRGLRFFFLFSGWPKYEDVFLESQPWKRVKTGKAQQQNNGSVVTRGWIWRLQSDHSEQSDLIIIISD